jgi:hypothetical protein
LNQAQNGSDEEDHAVTKVELDDRRMIAAMGFLDHVRPPARHRQGDAEEADQHHADPPRMTVEPHHRAAGQGQRRERADQRPDARRQDVILVVLRSGHVALPCLKLVSL